MKDLKNFLLPYQKNYLADNSKTAIYIKSRRIGITYVESLRAVLRRLEHPFDYNLVSANARTAGEFVSYSKKWCKVINEITGQEYIDLEDSTSEIIRFPNGSKIVALSSNPSALRGRGGDIVIDEAAYHENPEELWKAAQPVATWGGNIRLISSMSSPDHWFSQTVNRVERGELPWSLHKTTIYDAVNEGLARKVPGDWQKLLPDIQACNAKFIEDLKAEVGSEAVFSQEYECTPASQSMLLTPEMYDKLAITPLADKLNPNAEYGELFVGIDIGRFHDLTVIWVLERGFDKDAEPHLRDVYRTVAVHMVKGMAFEAQAQLIGQFLSHNCVSKCCIDKSGLGLQLAEQLYNQYGSIVEGVAITSPAKQDLVERTIKFITQERVSLPMDDRIKADIIAMKRIVTAKGNISYDGRSDLGHCDSFIALAMALRGAEKQSELSLSMK